MNPTPPQPQMPQGGASLPTSQSQLDPAVLNLMSGIRQVESQGNYQAKGKSGEYGAYQYTQPTWKGQAARYLGDANADWSDPANQNKVAYSRILDLKNQGFTPYQIASIWNSGKADPTGNVGTNSYGAAYDTPKYVANVLTAAQQAAQTRRKQSGQPVIPQVPQAMAATGDQQQPTQEPQPQGDLISKAAGAPNADWLDKAANIVSTIFPGRQIGQDIGTLLGYAAVKAHDMVNGTDTAKYYDLSAPSPLQAIGDVAQGALMVGTGMPEDSAVSLFGKEIPTLAKPASMLGRVAENTALGAGFGVTGAIASGNNQDIGSSATGGAAFGGAAGVFGEGLSKLADSLPKSLLSSALPKLNNPDTMDYALNKIKLGTMDGMINNSQKAINSYDNQIEAILSHPQYGAERIAGKAIVDGVMQSYPNSEYDLNTIISKLKSQVPTEAHTLTMLSNGQELTLDQANTLRKSLDKITYKTTIDSPEVKAGKDLAATVGNVIRDQVQTKAKETAPIFSDYSKEIRVFKALRLAAKAKGTGKIVTMKDLYSVLAGGAVGGIPGAVGSLALDKLSESPVTKIAGAKLASKLAPAAKGVGQATKLAGAVVPGRLKASK